MTIPLDTHTILWFLENNPKLPAITRNRIETTQTVFVSIVSPWEICIKANISKLNLSIPFSDIQPEFITQGITQLPITITDLEIYRDRHLPRANLVKPPIKACRAVQSSLPRKPIASLLRA